LRACVFRKRARIDAGNGAESHLKSDPGDRMNAYRVLHVEDDPDIREVVKMSLALDAGLTVISCSSGPDALAVAADWHPDVILMDAVMPVMDGSEMLAHLRESSRTASIPVVFMTARTQTSDVQHFLALGAAGVIAKPFDPLTLAASVRACLRGAPPAASAGFGVQASSPRQS
jgi:CheY-like chemotaxis protein